MSEAALKIIELIQKFRLFLLTQINDLTTEELNHIPICCNNNIIWNLAHLDAVLYILCYKNTGSEIPVAIERLQPFFPGTRPSIIYNDDEIHSIKQIFTQTLPRLEKDYKKGIFKNYQTPEKIKDAYGVRLHSIEDAMLYILHHEGIHFAEIFKRKQFIKMERYGKREIE